MFSLNWILGKFLSISFLKLRLAVVYICVRPGAEWNVTPLAVGGVKQGLQLVTTQCRTAGHRLWFYQSTSKMATYWNVGKISYHVASFCQRTFHWGLSDFGSVWFTRTCFFPHAPQFYIYIYIYIYIHSPLFHIPLSHMFSNNAYADLV